MSQTAIEYYHFHLYYPVEEIEKAKIVLNKVENEIKENLRLEIGRAWDKPVGPHPIGSCQVTVPRESFKEVSEWFLENRDGFDLFIHGVSGDDYKDHTKYVIWMGKEHPLNLEIFKKDQKKD